MMHSTSTVTEGCQEVAGSRLEGTARGGHLRREDTAQRGQRCCCCCKLSKEWSALYAAASTGSAVSARWAKYLTSMSASFASSSNTGWISCSVLLSTRLESACTYTSVSVVCDAWD